MNCLSINFNNSMTTPSINSYPCIPVMGVSVLEDPLNFVYRLAKSIDFCVSHFVLVLPAGGDRRSTEHPVAVSFMNGCNKSLFGFINITCSGDHLLGVAEGWNSILKSKPDAPWYLISGYDVQFLPKQLETLSVRFWNQSGELEKLQWKGSYGNIRGAESPPIKTIGNFIHTKWKNLPGGKGFSLFALSKEILQNVGYFDENLFPAFWEDRDYKIRLRLWKGTRIRTYRDIRPIHGLYLGLSQGDNNHSLFSSSSSISKAYQRDRKVQYISGTSYLSQSWKTLSHMAGRENREYACQKWGCSLKLSVTKYDLLNCTYKTPFNLKDVSLSHWVRNESRIGWLRKEYRRLILAVDAS